MRSKIESRKSLSHRQHFKQHLLLENFLKPRQHSKLAHTKKSKYNKILISMYSQMMTVYLETSTKMSLILTTWRIIMQRHSL